MENTIARCKDMGPPVTAIVATCTMNEMPAPAKLTGKSFRATLERGANRLGWVIVRIPFDVKEVWDTRGHLRVTGEINGFPFRGSLFPTGTGEHWMLVTKKMQAGGGAVPGSEA